MTLRITLLVLVTGLFAAIWTNDQTRPDAPNQHTSAIAHVKRDALSPRADTICLPVSQPSLVVESPAEIPMETAWMFAEEDPILPVGIVPGEYRAVSNTGTVRNITLTLAELQSRPRAEFITRDVYRSGDENGCWHFIRVQSDRQSTVAVIAERGSHIVLPAIAERSQTQRIQRQAGKMIVNAGQHIAKGLMHAVQNRKPIGGGWLQSLRVSKKSRL